jgi:GT2 family glycosyltransferase
MIYIYYENPVFEEIALGLYRVFSEQDLKVKLVSKINDDNFLDLYIIFGMNDFNSRLVPNNYIVYQLEQTTGQEQSNWFSQTYINYLQKALAVWDYSLVNYKNLRQIDIKAIEYVPIQYMDGLDKKFQPVLLNKDIDILFYGSINDRRRLILDQLIQRGYNIVSRSNVWKDERDQLIARAKIVINIHYYDHSILESVRLSYLLSNHCFVISEKSQDPILDRWHKKYLKIVDYDQLVNACDLALAEEKFALENDTEYQSHPYSAVVPVAKLRSIYGYLLSSSSTEPITEASSTVESSPTVSVDNSDIFEAESEITKDQELILKLPKFTYNELPHVSIVTVTYNRKAIFPIAVRNWELFEYPKDKMEWIIIDDSGADSDLSEILPKSKAVKYYKLQTTGRLSIGQKRNFGVEKATHDYIVFMDDDDYYYPLSVYARIGLLLKYPQYNLVGVAHLDIYDVVNDFSAKINSPYISEASMAFRKKFWIEEHFPDKFSTLGEGYPFTKGRRDQIIKMPSCFNLIALTHWENYTQTNRSYQKFSHLEKRNNLLKVLDLPTRLFIFDLFDKIKPDSEELNTKSS